MLGTFVKKPDGCYKIMETIGNLFDDNDITTWGQNFGHELLTDDTSDGYVFLSRMKMERSPKLAASMLDMVAEWGERNAETGTLRLIL